MSELVRRLAAQERALAGTAFVAPLAAGGRVRVRRDDVVFTLRAKEAVPGWRQLRALDGARAEVTGDAEPWQRGDYLARLPALRLVVLREVGAGTWLALPYNGSDLLQRFPFRLPLVVRLVEGGAPFSRVVGRVEGQTVWYDAPDGRADPTVAELLRLELDEGRAAPSLGGLDQGEAEAFRVLAAARQTAKAESESQRMRGLLAAALATAGARLVACQRRGDDWRVTWERAGARSTTLVDDRLGVVSAGICLSGADRQFDLTSIVGVVQASPWFAGEAEA